MPVLDAEGLRPTSDRVRETLFNWLMFDLQGACCLDLFAGSGALGIESLSRGASFVQFVECNKRVATQLKNTLHELAGAEEQDRFSLTEADGVSWLDRPIEIAFDVIFLDPPYADNLLPEVFARIELNSWLAEGGKIYLEQDSSAQAVSVPPNWELLRNGKAGQISYSLYQRVAA